MGKLFLVLFVLCVVGLQTCASRRGRFRGSDRERARDEGSEFEDGHRRRGPHGPAARRWGTGHEDWSEHESSRSRGRGPRRDRDRWTDPEDSSWMGGVGRRHRPPFGHVYPYSEEALGVHGGGRRRGPGHGMWSDFEGSDFERPPWGSGGQRHRHDRKPWWGQFELDFSFDFDGEALFDMNWGKSWWQGENVCYTKTEKVDDDASHLSYTSVSYHDSYDLFKISKSRMTRRGLVTTTEIYECCDGYKREGNDIGCLTEIQLFSLSEMLVNLELNEFRNLLNSTGLDEDVLDTGTTKLTVFAPTNESLSLYLPLVHSARSSDKMIKDMPDVVIVSPNVTESIMDDARNLLLGHVAVGHMTSSKFENDQLLETVNPFKTSIRLNIYSGMPEKVRTADCKRITSIDNMATNGVIHIVDGVLTPVTDTLLDLIKKNPELSTLKTALGSSVMGSLLKDKNAHYTLLAPTDAAFNKHEQLLRKITTSPDCMDNVLKNHIIPITLCSAAVSEQIKVQNLLRHRLVLSRDIDGKIVVDGAQIIGKDVMATNGVLHIIDELLLPDEALDILQIVEKNGLGAFGKLVDMAGMKKDIRAAENITLFIPSNEAIESLPEQVLDNLIQDKQALQNLLLYHMVPKVFKHQRRHVNSYYTIGSAQGAPLAMQDYLRGGRMSLFFGNDWAHTVQCAEIHETSYKGCNSAVYIIDKVMLPPPGNVIDVLARDKRFTTLVELLKMSDMADLLQEDGPFTVFAPTNEAFKVFGTDAVEEMKENPATLKMVLQNHVAAYSICCSFLTRTTSLTSGTRIETMSGNRINIGRSYGGNYLEPSDFTECDTMATNGVVHVIDKIFIRNTPRPSWSFHMDLDLPDWMRG